MSLKRRNIIAILLIFVAAVCWAFGHPMLKERTEYSAATTYAPTEASILPSTVETVHPSEERTVSTTIVVSEPPEAVHPSEERTVSSTIVDSNPTGNVPVENARSERTLGMILSLAAVIAGALACFVLSQKNAILGPDGLCFALALLAAVYHRSITMAHSFRWGTTQTFLLLSAFVCAFVILLCARELYGWIRAGFSLSWCSVQRIAKGCRTPQLSLLVFVAWILLPFAVLACFSGARSYGAFWICVAGFGATSVFGILCLWKYGTDLSHFKKQLSNYQQGKPITVGDGAFAQTEAQLLDVQAQHEEAVRTAVTSERFKVELIANVSHDLRTPLTSILGYSELLQKETLSPQGQEQLRRLHQKAGYMNELVESLFELTKVSSGVAESKKDRIDLVRLLEQTIGLFDDQLVNAGLTVRRRYGADSIPVVTDGARLHQVFANLLGNAIKYALAGTRIYLEIGETADSYRIRMINTASYEMDFQPDEILQRFARGDKARSTKGSGLGLAIAQTYTESVGGSFRVSVDGDQFSAIVQLPKN